MSEKALVLSADAWEMPDEKTGEIRTGWSCWFVNSYRDDSPKSFGYKPTKISVTPDLAKELRSAKLPAVCELQYGSRPGAGGKATLTVVGFKLISSVDFASL